MLRRGFTIVELLISISIFVFLTTVTVLSFRGAGFANSVRANGASLSASIRSMQAYAISGRSVSVCSNYAVATPTPCSSNATCGVNTCVSVVPLGGFGVHVPSANATSFQLFADLDNSKSYTATGDVLVDTGTVQMSDKTYLAQAGTVVFTPPKGSVTIIPSNAANTATFCVRHASFTNIIRKVIVHGITGLVDESGVQTCP